MQSTLSTLGREALRIVLPAWCAACEKELPWRERTASCCARCWSSLPRIAVPTCTFCALPAPPGHEGTFVCFSCEHDPPRLDWCAAWGHYRGTLERLLHALKFRRHDFLDDALASLLHETLRARGDLAFDAIIGVPMTRAKERKRGYNQAELLARALARRAAVRCDMTLLARRDGRATQSTLRRSERAENVRGAFAASSRVKGRSILVVDDICTSGETLRACAAALRSAGAARVAALVVARTS
ncbi:MAG TPA: phosphoribosyltransferase family protein [Thermoanaerobaculia bacterium]